MPSLQTVAVLGAGNRGRESYGRYIREHPGKIEAVAVAEPDQDRREMFAEEHNLSPEQKFSGWRELLTEDRLAEGIIISTLDTMHVQPAVRALQKGYDILLEKPIAPNLEGIRKIYRKYQETDGTILVGHVLRYTRFFRKLKELLDSNAVGDVRFVDLIENIGFYHFAHSFVRGNWRNTDVAAPIILAKSCHDLDILHWLLGNRTELLSSHASQEVFREESRPDGAADRCLDCSIESECPYSARKIYLRDSEGSEWPASVITTNPSYEGRMKALKEGPYGRCVWNCDNNVPEVQRVSMTQKDNTEVNFTLTAFSREITRTIKIFGSRGEIRANFDQGTIRLYRFDEHVESIDIEARSGGHSGGDTGIMDQYVEVLERGEDANGGWATSLEESIESHLMAFAAEEARKENKVVSLPEWRKNHFQ